MKSLTSAIALLSLFVLSLDCALDREQPNLAQEGKPCGVYGIKCEAGLFCDSDDLGSIVGTCTEISESCIQDFYPVCGRDGETYFNDCVRKSAEVSLAHVGPCEEGGLEDHPTATSHHAGLFLYKGRGS